MGDWIKTGCVLCAQNCGLEVQVEDNRIAKVRGDKDNPRSKGYCCRKGMNIANHQHHEQRLTHPLKRIGDKFEKISWDQALTEISEKFKNILDEHGPRSYAYMGGGGQGCHFEAGFGVSFMKALGSRYHYSPIGQELSGIFWGFGRILGRQNLHALPDEHNTEMLVALGWNGMQSHQMPRAPITLREISKDPDKLLVVIDPRKSETAKIANIHLPIKPGTDALLIKAIISIILNEGWEDKEYIIEHVTGFEELKPLFIDIDAKDAIKVCELDYDEVYKFAKLLSTKKWCVHPDLGVYMNRHSTLTTYLGLVLCAICGRLCVPGGNNIMGYFMPICAHTDERDERTWRTVETDFPALAGVFPPNVMPEEIISERPDRLRAVIVCGSNPLRSYADTTAYEDAFDKLDLLVTCELAMTETAKLSHYVLPARSGYESWDATFFSWTFPEVYFQMRRPIIEPEGEPLEASEIFVRLADALGIIPDIPDTLYEAARGDKTEFIYSLMDYVLKEKISPNLAPFIIAKTLGKQMGSVNLSALWGLLNTAPKIFKKHAKNLGFKGRAMAEDLFQAIIDHPEGLWIGRCDPEKNFKLIMNPGGKINVFHPDMTDWIQSITPESERKALEVDEEYPLILQAGLHTNNNANTLMRNPEWNEGRRACTVAMNPKDVIKLQLKDGQMVRVSTAAGSVEIELEETDKTRVGQVLIPHGFGLNYEGNVYGANVNRLAKNTHRDRLAGTPLHRYIRCKVEPV
ncbi:MAG: molybdopterin-dependent oxidoreductase [Candidatus Hodarchaeota archaeon]